MRCRPELAAAFIVVARAAEVEEKAWLSVRRERLDEEARALVWSAARLRQARDELTAERLRLREAGVLRGTHGLVVLPALRALLEARGWWGRRWRPVPPGGRLGRSWGAGDQSFKAVVAVDLPVDVGQTVTRGCWWTSRPHVERLKAFHTVHGNSWRGQLHGGGLGRRGDGPTPAELRARSRTAGKVITTGMVLREALAVTVGRPDLAVVGEEGVA